MFSVKFLIAISNLKIKRSINVGFLVIYYDFNKLILSRGMKLIGII